MDAERFGELEGTSGSARRRFVTDSELYLSGAFLVRVLRLGPLFSISAWLVSGALIASAWVG